MRHIDISALIVEQGWLDDAGRLLAEISPKTPEQRKEFWKDSNKHIWGKLKPLLEALSHGKCWYCEVKLPRAPFHVDHFRPKGGRGNVGHSGYWWLAYDYKNYRLACPTCNSSGKGDRFPLEDGCPRALRITDDLLAEIPLLLDPTNPNDPTLIDYEPSGEVKPQYTIANGSRDYIKVDTSIWLYRLNEEPLREERKSLYRQIKKYLDCCVDSKIERLEENLGDLVSLVLPTESFSAFARSRLFAFKSDPTYSWVVNLIEEKIA